MSDDVEAMLTNAGGLERLIATAAELNAAGWTRAMVLDWLVAELNVAAETDEGGA